MFDINDPNLARLKKDSPIERLRIPEVKKSDGLTDELDGDEAQERHDRLMAYYRQELDRQSENRFQMAIDEDYYDNEQWTPEEAQALKERGQAPTVYNVISTSVDWIIGSEKRGRTDFKILPRGKEDAKAAERKTKYLKYLSDVNRTQFHRSRAFEDAVKVGIGWIEAGVQDEDDGEPIYDRYESWRNILFDSSSTELDGSDMRYIFRSKWVDEDIAKALFPERADVIELSVVDSSLYGTFDLVDGDVPMDIGEFDRSHSGNIYNHVVTHKRRRVRLIEASYKVPEKTQKMRGGPFNGEIYDENDPRHLEAVNNGQAGVISKMMMRTRIALFTHNGLLWDGPSPYRHNKHKFIPVWGHKRGRDGLPYGVIRRMRDIQDGVNKRASKALYILSTNKVVMDEGAVDDIEEFRDEVARPDAIIVKKPGRELALNVDRDLAAAHIELMGRDISMLQQVGGVTDELLGRTTNAVSGVAVERRQEQGSLATSKFFDNLRFAEQLRGEIELSLMEQYATEEKQFRITNMRGAPEFVTINDGLPENDITRSKADFVISEADWRATMRQAAVEQLTDMLMKMPPEVGLNMLDLIVDQMDVPNREEIAKRIRSINGQRDPDQAEMTPEEQQQMQAAKDAQQFQQEVAMSELENKKADTAAKIAQAKRHEAEAMRISQETSSEAEAMLAEAQGKMLQAQIENRQEMFDLQTRLQQQIMGIQQQASEAMAKYQEEITVLKAELASKQDMARVELEKAAIDANTDVEKARIQAIVDQKVAQIQAENGPKEEAIQNQFKEAMKDLSSKLDELKTVQIRAASGLTEPPTIVVNMPETKPTTKKVTLNRDKDGKLIGGDVKEVPSEPEGE